MPVEEMYAKNVRIIIIMNIGMYGIVLQSKYIIFIMEKPLEKFIMHLLIRM